MPVVSVMAEHIVNGSIENEVNFNGSTVYLKKTEVLSPISGFVVRTNIAYGQEVPKDMVLFELQTREAKALESDNNLSGTPAIVEVDAVTSGFISELNVIGKGGYVAEGSVLCYIVNNSDLMVRVNVPFEYISLLRSERNCEIRLADNTVIPGTVSRILPTVDEENQTQTVLIKPGSQSVLPENLNLIVSFVNEKHENTLLVSKSALQTNETQSEFWVMKIDGGETAVMVTVEKGLENDNIVEIITPDLNVNNMIISEGAYGLPDSTVVSIVN